MARNVSQLHPRLQQKLREFQALCSSQGIQIVIGECLRTEAEQNALYAIGRTVAGKKVTNARGTSYSSQHQWGVAADFYLDMDVDQNGKTADDSYNNSKGYFEKAGALAKSVGLGWGGDWTSMRDLPHVYLPDWGSTPAKLKAVYKTPQNFFASWQKESTPANQAGSEKNKPTENKSVSAANTASSSKDITINEFLSQVKQALGINSPSVSALELLGKTVTISKTINQKHPLVKTLQKYLNALGYPAGTPDGIAGSQFDAAVRSFQAANSLIVDGELTAKAASWKKLLKA